MGELLEALRVSAPPVQWSTAGLKARLAPIGMSSEQVELMSSVCAPQTHARGLRRAVLGLRRLYPDEMAVESWYRALSQLANSDRRIAAGLDAMPYATKSPVARFLSELTAKLPFDVVARVHRHMLHLVATDHEAQNSAYTTYLAAKHLAEERARNAGVAREIANGRVLAAIAIMHPPTVREPAVLEGYRAALRTALGHRRIPVRHLPHEKDQKTPRAPSVRTRTRIDTPSSLVDVLAAATPASPPETQLVHEDGAPVRVRAGLTTNAALGIPRGLSGLDGFALHVLLERLRTGELDQATRWQLQVVVTVLYCTGWPARLLSELGQAVSFDAKLSTVTVPAELHPLGGEFEGRPVVIVMAPTLVQQLTSIVGADQRISLRLRGEAMPFHGGHLSALLRHLSRNDAAPVTLSMLRGAVWFAGRADGWTPQRLVLATCTSDPAFKQACHYPLLPPVIDARPLHELMLAILREGARELVDVQHGRGFAVI